MNTKENIFVEKIEMVKSMVHEHIPLAEIARQINFKYSTLKKYLLKYKIEYSANTASKGFVKSITKYDLSVFLNNEKTISAPNLRNKLIRAGLKEYRCECCSGTTWFDKPIPLELHHKNGNHYDNSLDNLEILCSNCHSAKHGYGQTIKYTVEDVVKKVKETKKQVENKKEKIVKYCSICGTKIQGRGKTDKCMKCFHIDQRKVEWPTRDELIQLHSKFSNVKISKMYGVSDKTISKWLKHYNIT